MSIDFPPKNNFSSPKPQLKPLEKTQLKPDPQIKPLEKPQSLPPELKNSPINPRFQPQTSFSALPDSAEVRESVERVSSSLALGLMPLVAPLLGLETGSASGQESSQEIGAISGASPAFNSSNSVAEAPTEAAEAPTESEENPIETDEDWPPLAEQTEEALEAGMDGDHEALKDLMQAAQRGELALSETEVERLFACGENMQVVGLSADQVIDAAQAMADLVAQLPTDRVPRAADLIKKIETADLQKTPEMAPLKALLGQLKAKGNWPTFIALRGMLQLSQAFCAEGSSQDKAIEGLKSGSSQLRRRASIDYARRGQSQASGLEAKATALYDKSQTAPQEQRTGLIQEANTQSAKARGIREQSIHRLVGDRKDAQRFINRSSKRQQPTPVGLLRDAASADRATAQIYLDQVRYAPESSSEMPTDLHAARTHLQEARSNDPDLKDTGNTPESIEVGYDQAHTERDLESLTYAALQRQQGPKTGALLDPNHPLTPVIQTQRVTLLRALDSEKTALDRTEASPARDLEQIHLGQESAHVRHDMISEREARHQEIDTRVQFAEDLGRDISGLEFKLDLASETQDKMLEWSAEMEPLDPVERAALALSGAFHSSLDPGLGSDDKAKFDFMMHADHSLERNGAVLGALTLGLDELDTASRENESEIADLETELSRLEASPDLSLESLQAAQDGEYDQITLRASALLDAPEVSLAEKAQAFAGLGETGGHYRETALKSHEQMKKNPAQADLETAAEERLGQSKEILTEMDRYAAQVPAEAPEKAVFSTELLDGYMGQARREAALDPDAALPSLERGRALTLESPDPELKAQMEMRLHDGIKAVRSVLIDPGEMQGLLRGGPQEPEVNGSRLGRLEAFRDQLQTETNQPELKDQILLEKEQEKLARYQLQDTLQARGDNMVLGARDMVAQRNSFQHELEEIVDEGAPDIGESVLSLLGCNDSDEIIADRLVGYDNAIQAQYGIAQGMQQLAQVLDPEDAVGFQEVLTLARIEDNGPGDAKALAVTQLTPDQRSAFSLASPRNREQQAHDMMKGPGRALRETLQAQPPTPETDLGFDPLRPFDGLYQQQLDSQYLFSKDVQGLMGAYAILKSDDAQLGLHGLLQGQESDWLGLPAEADQPLLTEASATAGTDQQAAHSELQEKMAPFMIANNVFDAVASSILPGALLSATTKLAKLGSVVKFMGTLSRVVAKAPKLAGVLSKTYKVGKFLVDQQQKLLTGLKELNILKGVLPQKAAFDFARKALGHVVANVTSQGINYFENQIPGMSEISNWTREFTTKALSPKAINVSMGAYMLVEGGVETIKAGTSELLSHALKDHPELSFVARTLADSAFDMAKDAGQTHAEKSYAKKSRASQELKGVADGCEQVREVLEKKQQHVEEQLHDLEQKRETAADTPDHAEAQQQLDTEIRAHEQSLAQIESDIEQFGKIETVARVGEYVLHTDMEAEAHSETEVHPDVEPTKKQETADKEDLGAPDWDQAGHAEASQKEHADLGEKFKDIDFSPLKRAAQSSPTEPDTPDTRPQATSGGNGVQSPPPPTPPEGPDGPSEPSGPSGPDKTPSERPQNSGLFNLDGEQITLRGYRAEPEVLTQHKLKDHGLVKEMRAAYFDTPDLEAGFSQFKSDTEARWQRSQGDSGLPMDMDDGQLRAHFDTLKDMSDDELRAVIGYMGEDGQIMNAIMREDPSALDCYAEDMDRIKVNIKAALHSLDKLPKYTGTAYRGMELSAEKAPGFLTKYQEAQKTGQAVFEPQFMSSTAHAETNVHLQPDMGSEAVHIRLEIESENGIDYRGVNPDEDEIIMPPGSYHVDDIIKAKDGDKWIYRILLKDEETQKK